MPRTSQIRDFARANPPTTAAGLGTAVGVLLMELASWGIAAVPGLVPVQVAGALYLVASGIAVFAGGAIGRCAQRFTWPVTPAPVLEVADRAGGEFEADSDAA